MSTETKNTAPEVRYGGYLSEADKVKDGITYSYNWAKVTAKADLDKRKAEAAKEADAGK